MKRVLWDMQFLRLLLIALLVGVGSWSISWVGVFVFGWGFGDATGNDAFGAYLFLIASVLALPSSIALWSANLVLKHKKGAGGEGDLQR